MRRGESSITHGQYVGGIPTPTMNSYKMMIRRCYDENSDQYPFYGGRGIKVCNSWIADFSNFLRDMGERPDGKFLDRGDNDGNYDPDNCRWITHKENCKNRRSTRWIVVDGERYTLKDFANKFCRRKRQAIHMSISKGWPESKIIKWYLKDEHKDRDVRFEIPLDLVENS